MKTIKIFAAAIMMMSATMASADVVKNSAKEIPSEAPIYNKVTVSSNYKTTYKKDEQGRIINKIIFKAVDGIWNPIGAYSVYYGEDENVVTYAQWDPKTSSFVRNAVQEHFSSKEFPVLFKDSTK